MCSRMEGTTKHSKRQTTNLTRNTMTIEKWFRRNRDASNVIPGSPIALHARSRFRAYMGRCLVLWCCCAGLSGVASGQENALGLDVFGYAQVSFAAIQGTSVVPSSSSFLLQQMDLMLGRQFDSRFSMFADIQFTNSYSSNWNWGVLNLEEGWVKYSAGLGLNVKAGLLIPSFNAMHQIKNRTPLIPYIFRPFVYETAMANIIDFEAFLPMRAYVEVYGRLPIGTLYGEYAVYAGNSDAGFIASEERPFMVSGMDTTKFKLVGARIGVSNSWLRAGASFTSDKENHTNMGIGFLRRYRFGGDISVRVEPLTMEGEVIVVRPQMGDQERAIMEMLSSSNPLIGKDFDRLFWYGTLLWDVTEEYFAYGTYAYVQSNENAALSYGLRELSFGGGWRPIEQIVVKAQIAMLRMDSPSYPVDLNNYLLAISVNF